MDACSAQEGSSALRRESCDCQLRFDCHGSSGLKEACWAACTGNIRVGRRARVAAGSMVLKAVEEDMLVAGNPAKVIGKLVDVSKPCIPAQ